MNYKLAIILKSISNLINYPNDPVIRTSELSNIRLICKLLEEEAQ